MQPQPRKGEGHWSQEPHAHTESSHSRATELTVERRRQHLQTRGVQRWSRDAWLLGAVGAGSHSTEQTASSGFKTGTLQPVTSVVEQRAWPESPHRPGGGGTGWAQLRCGDIPRERKNLRPYGPGRMGGYPTGAEWGDFTQGTTWRKHTCRDTGPNWEGFGRSVRVPQVAPGRSRRGCGPREAGHAWQEPLAPREAAGPLHALSHR